MVLALYLGIASIAFALAAAVMRPSERSMLLVALSFFLSSLCFLFILWSNTRVDIESILDTANGWFLGGAALMAISTALSAICLVRYLRGLHRARHQ